jgi:hypothetical protein
VSARLGFGLLIAVVLGLGGIVLSRNLLARARAQPAYQFDPMRVALGDSVPAWLDPAMARAFLSTYQHVASKPFSLLDQASLTAWAKRVKALAWVQDCAMRLRLPDAAHLSLTLRRPVAYAQGALQRTWLFDRDGSRFPLHGQGNHATSVLASTERLPELRGLGAAEAPHLEAYCGAAQVAACFMEEVLPSVAKAAGPGVPLPRLLGIDLANAGLRRSRDRPEFRVVVAGPTKRPVFLEWGHAPGSSHRLVPASTKAEVLALILRERPGLAGLAAADLRFRHRWRVRLVAAQ